MSREEDITTKFKVDVSDLKKGITEANKNIKLANAEFRAASAGMDNWQNSTKGLQAKLDQLKSVLTQQAIKLKNYKNQLKEVEDTEARNSKRADELRKKLQELASQGVSKTSDEYKKYERALNDVEKEQIANGNAADKLRITILNQEATVKNTSAEYKKYATTLDKVEDEARQAESANENLGKSFEDVETGSKTLSENFTVMKGALASLVADGIRKSVTAVKDFAKASFESGSNFQAAMSKVQSVSGASGKDLEKLTALAEKMGATTKFTATEAAEALNYMAMAGWKTEDMISGLPGILNLAAASGADLATTSDIVTDALTAMGYSAADSGRLADVMAAASSNANTNVEMMGATFQYAAPIVGALGYSMEDTAVAIGLMANAGIKGEKAGTALRSALTRLSAPPTECAKAMEELGISITNTDGTMKPLNKLIEELRNKFNGLSESQQTQYAKALAGQEAMSGLLAIINAAPEDFNKLTAAVDSSTGSAEKMAKTMQDNVAGDLTTLKSKIESVQITIFKKLEPTIRKVIQTFQKWANSVDWNAVGVKIEKAVKKVIKVFEWFVENKSLVITVVKAMIAAYAVSKIISFAKGFNNVTKAIKASTIVTNAAKAATLLFTGVTKGATLAQNAHTLAVNAGTVATKAFNLAWKANPLGLAITAAALLVGGIYALTKAVKTSTEETDKNTIATDKMAKKQKELNKQIKENSEARKENMTAAQEEAGTADFLFERLDKLAGVENKTNEQKAEMKRLVAELNTIMPDLNLAYDEEKDKLNKSTEAIRENITAQKDLILAKAAQENLTKIAEDIVKVENEASEATKQHAKNEKIYTDAKKARADFDKQHTAWEISNNPKLKKQRDELLKAEISAESNYKKSKKSVENYNKTLKDLNGTYESTSESAAKYLDKADISKGMADLIEKAKAAGREIPQAISDGINNGKYAIPQSMEQLDKLITFDDVLTKAGLSGKQIPSYISQGVLDGKMSIEQAMDKINQVTTLSDQAQKLIDEGKAIPKNLSKGILDGTYSVEEATKILQDKVTYNDLKKKAKEAGAAIPKNLVENIQNGSISVEQASQILQSSIDFTNKVKEASDAGIKIPKSLAEGITSGQIKPSEAMARVQALINYEKMFKEADLSGKAIPKKLHDGIISGEMSISEANNAMNNWITFKKSLDNAGQSGIKIPQQLANGIISGEISVSDANTQMNNWIKFQAALDEAGLSGIKIPKELQNGILSGKTSVKDAVEQLNNQIENEAQKAPNKMGTIGSATGDKFAQGVSSKKSEAVTAGGNLIDGVNQGIGNQNKQSSAFSTVWSFGTKLLNNLRNSLKEHSPSKATDEMGQFLLEGLGIGIKKKEKDVLKQISQFGKNVIENLNEELNTNIDIETTMDHMKTSLNKAKTSLSSITNPTIGSYPNNVTNRTVQQKVTNVYNQYNNSPKALSRLEIFRDTKALLFSSKGGLQNV